MMDALKALAIAVSIQVAAAAVDETVRVKIRNFIGKKKDK